MPDKKYYCKLCLGTGTRELEEGVFTKCKDCKGRGWNLASELDKPKAPKLVVAPEAEAATKVEPPADPEEETRSARVAKHIEARAEASEKAATKKQRNAKDRARRAAKKGKK